MHPGAAAAFSGTAFWCLHQITVSLLDWAQLNPNVHWVYLPSGVRLAATLLLGCPACLGIALATLLTDWSTSASFAWEHAAGTAVISGFSPLLARHWGRRWLNIPDDLSGLNSRSLVLLAGLFALISATLHQAWFLAAGRGSHGVTPWLAMVIGDLTGALAVLLILGWLLVWWEKVR